MPGGSEAGSNGPGARGLSRGKQFLFTLVILVVTLLLAETLLRWLDYPPGETYTVEEGNRWALRPNLHASLMTHHESGTTFHVSTDARGLRLTPPDGPPTPGCQLFTILLLGDSNTFGWGLEDDETWATSLEHALADRGVRVINGGMPGYTVVQCLSLFERVGRLYRPQMVILSVGMHDIAWLQPMKAPAPMPPKLVGFRGFLLSHSRIARALRLALESEPATGNPAGGEPNASGLPPGPQGQLPDHQGQFPPRRGQLSAPQGQLPIPQRQSPGSSGDRAAPSSQPGPGWAIKVPEDQFRGALEAFVQHGQRQTFQVVTAPIPGINTSRYRSIMEELATKGELVHIDITPPAPYGRLPKDENHLDAEGAKRFGEDVGAALVPYLPVKCR